MSQCVGQVKRLEATGEPEGQLEGWFKTAKDRFGLHRFGESALLVGFPSGATCTGRVSHATCHNGGNPPSGDARRLANAALTQLPAEGNPSLRSLVHR
ncbi:hypothetical protein I8752_25905 [Nostocaceae cyanobacterium CENA369]|uniref:Uncharacterized protein n=1 Tax=Dendronalium phyllosphericum CENA369 TaxID=1725256 RepID=A0A8J7LHX7_9NOST|nr:hypothetical protein [Dendronalium phyllosphericum]MBH8576364.1 hypothetical protein [Dendronalium phyllosphericum CENA369]